MSQNRDLEGYGVDIVLIRVWRGPLDTYKSLRVDGFLLSILAHALTLCQRGFRERSQGCIAPSTCDVAEIAGTSACRFQLRHSPQSVSTMSEPSTLRAKL